MAFVQFLLRVRVHWGTLVTGGFGIGLLSTYQGVGHQVPPWVYWSIAGVAVFWACFLAWLDEHKAVAKALADKSDIEQHLNRQIAALQKPAPLSPKMATLRLSKEILDFYYDRSKDAPPITEDNVPPYELSAETIEAMGYQTETLDMFEYKFRRETHELVASLKREGMSGEDIENLETLTEDRPSQAWMIKIIATDLMELADKMTAP